MLWQWRTARELRNSRSASLELPNRFVLAPLRVGQRLSGPMRVRFSLSDRADQASLPVQTVLLPPSFALATGQFHQAQNGRPTPGVRNELPRLDGPKPLEDFPGLVGPTPDNSAHRLH